MDTQPFPGTPDASVKTDIAFPGLAPGQLKSITVVGSRSGAHRGRVHALPAGHGTSFVPLQPFAGGERVFVRATLDSPAAGAAVGAPGATRVHFSFTVGAPPSIRPGGPSSGARAARHHKARRRRRHRVRPSFNTRTQRFHSETWLRPPVIHVSGEDPDPDAGDIFADAQDNVESGPLILNPQGRLIYFRPLRQTGAFNVEVQRYRGQSVLTYWQGVGIDPGHGVILDHSYHQIARVDAGNGYGADAHEFEVTPQGEAFLTVYAPVKADLSSIGGPRHGILMDSIVQEVDIATGAVLWEWHASGHVPLSATYAGTPARWPFDYFHVNSIQPLPDGKLLISGRNTWSLYEVDMRTGRVVLVIGGRHSMFRMGPGTNFEWQHHARMQPDGTITVFDNATAGGSPNERQSRALRLRLDFRRRRVTLMRAFTNRPSVLAPSQGSVQPLSDGNTFVGWGAAPYITEFGPDGRQRFRLRFPSPVQSYRAYRFQWWGRPTTLPSVAATATGKATTVYASWNGATDVASWRVLAGPEAGSLLPVGQYPDTSFETAMAVSSTERYFKVQALDATGNVLGTSAEVPR